MPIRKPLATATRNGMVILYPNPEKWSGGIEVLASREESIALAKARTLRLSIDSYVVHVGKVESIENGYVVTSYAGLWDYFGDSMEDEIVFHAKATV